MKNAAEFARYAIQCGVMPTSGHNGGLTFTIFGGSNEVREAILSESEKQGVLPPGLKVRGMRVTTVCKDIKKMPPMKQWLLQVFTFNRLKSLLGTSYKMDFNTAGREVWINVVDQSKYRSLVLQHFPRLGQDWLEVPVMEALDLTTRAFEASSKLTDEAMSSVLDVHEKRSAEHRFGISKDSYLDVIRQLVEDLETAAG